MKRYLALIPLMLLLLSACGDSIRLPDASYTLSITEEYLKEDGNSVKLLYPTLTGFPDAEIQAAVNAEAAAQAYRHYKNEGLMNDSDGGYTYTALEAEIMLASRDFYSVCIVGVITSDVSGGRDTFAYTLNCDLITGTFMESEDIIADYKELAEDFQSKNFDFHFGGEDPASQFSRKSLLEQYKADYGIYPYVYFTEGGFGILADTLPSMGKGCAGYLADVRDVRRHLHTDNAAVAALCGLEKE